MTTKSTFRSCLRDSAAGSAGKGWGAGARTPFPLELETTQKIWQNIGLYLTGEQDPLNLDPAEVHSEELI